MLGLIIFVGIFQSWNVALSIFNMCLISAVMTMGANIQWGYAGLINFGLMGYAALGGLNISHQYGIAFGDFDSGPLRVNGTPYEYKNRLLKFDGRIEHSVPAWSGNYRCNLFFYKHYDRRWTKPDPLLAAPSYVLDLEPTGTREPPQKRQRVN